MRGSTATSLLALLLVASSTVAMRTVQLNTTFKVDISLDPEHRFDEVCKAFPNFAKDAKAYAEQFLPKAAIPVVDVLVDAIDTVLGERGKEMKGYAKCTGLDLGTLVALNYAYELRRLGPAAPNTTTPGDYHGMCTSIVAQQEDGTMVHGRNMDWNLDNAMRPYTILVDFYDGDKHLFQGITFVGFIGLITAYKPGQFSMSMDAREEGGAIAGDFLQMIFKGGVETSYAGRVIMQEATDYESARTLASTISLAAPIYIIMAGSQPGEGCVVTRDRDAPVDVWDLSATGSWYLIETNYDHWQPAPAGDDRRDYGIKHMDAVGQDKISIDTLFDVMSMYPTMNNNTEYTTVFAPAKSYFAGYVRYTN
uniref:N-acylethanolamine-hydrolyzing acid amidase n=1 Tax=Palpitomonas bilix TaxID=652834 RepID=A0A7S3GIA7_9EUKA|eukprot:CAMPEP_0113883016 /NCGR_PEP_ID=MMETSP0780_2-20120614/9323_1 /TAXON_ID=652834 /ORGANISM="Palpitomonas bilix" /LENGTH=364 /DNA_ID=CAMNT_0000870189 /DNA_START=59 /DNA_END=1153 /DNA_ORIENTATION=+ /assembly_acc=CAM_ASM_000599